MTKILLFISILKLALGQNMVVPSFDFSTIPTTPVTSCGVTNPTNSTQCTSSNTMFNYCCMLTDSSGKNLCQPVNPFTYLPSMTTYNVNGTNYNIKCDIAVGTTGSPCGVLGPKNYTECTKYSVLNSNSCCMYSNATMGLNYCFWIGMYMPISPVPSVQCTPPPATTVTTSHSYISFGSFISLILFALAL